MKLIYILLYIGLDDSQLMLCFIVFLVIRILLGIMVQIMWQKRELNLLMMLFTLIK
jgi:hypothetical protein